MKLARKSGGGERGRREEGVSRQNRRRGVSEKEEQLIGPVLDQIFASNSLRREAP